MNGLTFAEINQRRNAPEPATAPGSADPYHDQRQAALAWLGADYLCHTPQNRKLNDRK